MIIKEKNSQKQIDNIFVSSCRYGELEQIIKLFTDKEASYLPDIKADQSFGFRLAYTYNNIDVVKYLLTSKDMPENVVITDEIFKDLCEENNRVKIDCLDEIMNYIIWEYGIVLGEEGLCSLEEYPNVKIKYEKRELNKKLDNNLLYKDINKPKIKV